MKIADIIQILRERLDIPVGRHLYGVLGSYDLLDEFVISLRQARLNNGEPFPEPIDVNKSILESIPDDEFRQLVENEARRPEPTAKHVENAFSSFLASQLRNNGLVILSNLELLFAYNLELNILRTNAADDNRILLLLPGKRSGGRIIMFPEWPDGNYELPVNLIADNNLWELKRLV